jgi:sugar phosphate permease
MLYPLIPIFLTQYLSSPATIVGIVQGFAEGSAYFVQGFSGWISDKIKKPKLVTLIGYLLGAVAKPFIGFSTSWSQVLPARWLERTSAGIRSAPRDALIANSVSEEERGKAFGLEGVGDQAGAVIGPLVAIILYYYLTFILEIYFFLHLFPELLHL